MHAASKVDSWHVIQFLVEKGAGTENNLLLEFIFSLF